VLTCQTSVRIRTMALLLALASSGCASSLCFTDKPRVASRRDGMPETISSGRAVLIKPEPRRYCQVVFEPAFSTDHALWFTIQTSGDARVSVSTLTEDKADFFEASLDSRTAARLKRLCHSFLTAPRPPCARIGYDGVWYHAAHHVGDSGYAMRSFWSPRRGSVDEKFVRLAEALRDYVVAPLQLRSVYWWHIQSAESELECALEPDQPGCSMMYK
jgi:hypothetical protein